MKKAVEIHGLGRYLFRDDVIFVTRYSIAFVAEFSPFIGHLTRVVNLVYEKIFSFGSSVGVFLTEIPTDDSTVSVLLQAPSTSTFDPKFGIINNWFTPLGIDKRMAIQPENSNARLSDVAPVQTFFNDAFDIDIWHGTIANLLAATNKFSPTLVIFDKSKN